LLLLLLLLLIWWEDCLTWERDTSEELFRREIYKRCGKRPWLLISEMRSVIVVVVVVVAYMVGGLSYVGKRHFGRIVQERNLQEQFQSELFTDRGRVKFNPRVGRG